MLVKGRCFCKTACCHALAGVPMAAAARLIVRFFSLSALLAGLAWFGLGATRLVAQPGDLASLINGRGQGRIDHSELFQTQPALVAKAVAALPRTKRGQPQVYSLSIAAGGSQDIFGREAAAVQALFAKRLGAKAPSIVLSNARKDLNQLPLANRDNLASVLSEIGKRMDPKRDLLLFYITAHGAPKAFVQTDLPDGTWLDPIDAQFLAETLDKAGIKRRILIISACFSGSWIPALKSSDTIVLTAATPYRPSFGCNDRLEYTYYGAALINGGIGRGLSWADSYAELLTTISLQESRMRLPASGPMADVGENMDAIWNAPLGPTSAR